MTWQYQELRNDINYMHCEVNDGVNDDIPSTVTNQNAHMIQYNLLGVILFSPGGQLPKIIHQRSHAWG